MAIDFSKLITADAKFAAAKEAKRSEINRLRDQKETEGFPYMGKVIDSHERAAARIFGAVQAAQAALSANQPFSIDWTCADNSILTLDAQGMIGMSVAMAEYANALHETARTLKSQVDAATTQAELDAVEWP